MKGLQAGGLISMIYAIIYNFEERFYSFYFFDGSFTPVFSPTPKSVDVSLSTDISFGDYHLIPFSTFVGKCNPTCPIIIQFVFNFLEKFFHVAPRCYILIIVQARPIVKTFVDNNPELSYTYKCAHSSFDPQLCPMCAPLSS